MDRSPYHALARLVRRALAASLPVGVALACSMACSVDLVGQGATDGDGGLLGEGNGSGLDGGSVVDSGDAGVTDSCIGKCIELPAGWTPVARLPSGDSEATKCPTDWSPDRTLRRGVRPTATECVCTCGTPTKNPCAQGTLVVDFREGITFCNDGQRNVTVDGTCQPLGFAWSSANKGARAASLPAATVACGASAALPPLTDDGATELCHPSELAPACTTGGTCIPPTEAATLCLMRDGDVTCPEGFPNKVVGVDARGIDDGRACGACTCQSTATSCSNAKLSFYADAQCTQGERSFDANDQCNDLSGSGTPTHRRYTATPNSNVCAATADTVPVTGELSLPKVRSVCCR